MSEETLFVIKLTVLICTILGAAHIYRLYIAPFSTLKCSFNFWRLRRSLKYCYGQQNPNKISLDYRNKHQLNNVELTYGEILLQSLYQALKIAEIKPYEVFYDLGCGTGKCVCSAAVLFDIERAVGIEIQPPLYRFAKGLIRKLKSMNKRNLAWQSRLQKVKFIRGDILDVPFNDADVIFINATCFQLSNWRAIEAKFMELKPGSRIIMTTKYLKEPYFKQIHSDSYEMSWGYARLSVYQRTATASC